MPPLARKVPNGMLKPDERYVFHIPQPGNPVERPMML
jgi:hypothetical protein